MDNLRMFIPITKVDAEKRIVYGVATAEAQDLSGEICDYASTKPLYEKWSASFHTASGGKSLGNLRAMHGKVAAGKLTDIVFDDAQKCITIAAKVVDDDEWRKVEEGVYTGFSQGGRYVKRWADPAGSDVTRYTADPHEISLVDMPCLPGATFEIVKAAGESARAPFKTVIEEPAPEAIKAKAIELAKGGRWEPFAEPAFQALAKGAMSRAAKEKLHSRATSPQDEGDNPDADDDKGSSGGDEDNELSDAAIEQAGNAPASPGDKARTGETSRKSYEPDQFWGCGCAGHKHAKKADAVKCMKTQDEAAIAKAIASPLTAALAKGEAALGITTAPVVNPLAAIVDKLFPLAKREFTADERREAAKAGEAMPDGSYPIKTKEDLSNAIQAFGRAKNKAATKKHIMARAKAMGLESELPAAWSGADKMADGDLRKDLYGVSYFASAIATLALIYRDAVWERDFEGDNSTVPDDLCHLLRSAGEVLVSMANEEVNECMPDGGNDNGADVVIVDMAMGAGLNFDAMRKLGAAGGRFAALAKIEAPDAPLDRFFVDFAKVGARNSKADKARIQGIHDHSMSLGAECSAGNCGKDGVDSDLAKGLKTENNALRKEIADGAARVEGIVAEFGKRIANLEAQPAPAKAAITAVSKGMEGARAPASSGDALADFQKTLAAMTSADRAHALMKLSLANPVAVIK